jgi:4-amino-4-deoxy-L-arabinose transferase-like glycosyltransferase
MTRRWLYIIAVVYLVLGGSYALTTPIFEASDEFVHYPMVKHLADNSLSLPVQNPAIQTAWQQEGSQPPLYYMLAAVVTGGMDTSDMGYVRRINPHADIGFARPDGNANMIVHRPDESSTGTFLAVRVIRLLSVLLGLGTVIVTYCLAFHLFPERAVVVVGAAALNAALPMFLFISGSVNNDNLSNLLGNLLTLLIVLLLKRERAPRLRDYALLGVVTGAGLLAKFNISLLVLLVALALLIVSIRRRNPRPVIIGGAISGGLTILIAGWWYLRNLQLYGDPTGLNVFLDIVGRRAIPANAAQLWAERESFTRSFWGVFGGMNVLMPDWVYLLLNIFGGLAILGALAFLLRTALRRTWAFGRWLPALVTLVWIVITFGSYLRWTAETPASQGRLMFGALSSICVWLAVGLTWWLPQRLKHPIMVAAAGGLALLAAVAPFAVIAPAYVTPAAPAVVSAAPITFADTGGGTLRLHGGEVSDTQAEPGSYADVRLSWEIVAPFAQDWSLFLHLVTQDGVIVGQRDIYPGRGHWALSDLRQGFRWTDQLTIWIPDNAYAPQTLKLQLGWYRFGTAERLTVEGAAQTYWETGEIALVSRPNDLGVPNRLSVNFGHQVELVGYEMTDLSPNAGSAMQITLYWRGLRQIERDYVVFVHVIDPPTLTIYAGSDAQPAGWTRPMTTWTTGEIVADTHTLNVRADAPPGIYELEIGMYVQTPEGGFDRLRVVTPDGGMANDYAYLNRVRIIPRESAP